MQISYKPVVQACDDVEILMYTSKGEQTTNYKVSLHGTIAFISVQVRPGLY